MSICSHCEPSCWQNFSKPSEGLYGPPNRYRILKFPTCFRVPEVSACSEFEPAVLSPVPMQSGVPSMLSSTASCQYCAPWRLPLPFFPLTCLCLHRHPDSSRNSVAAWHHEGTLLPDANPSSDCTGGLYSTGRHTNHCFQCCTVQCWTHHTEGGQFCSPRTCHSRPGGACLLCCLCEVGSLFLQVRPEVVVLVEDRFSLYGSISSDLLVQTRDLGEDHDTRLDHFLTPECIILDRPLEHQVPGPGRIVARHLRRVACSTVCHMLFPEHLLLGGDLSSDALEGFQAASDIRLVEQGPNPLAIPLVNLFNPLSVLEHHTKVSLVEHEHRIGVHLEGWKPHVIVRWPCQLHQL